MSMEMSNSGLQSAGALAFVFGLLLLFMDVRLTGSFEQGDTKIEGPVFFVLMVIGVLMYAAGS